MTEEAPDYEGQRSCPRCGRIASSPSTLPATRTYESEITLRDLFAAFALAGQIANTDIGGSNASDEEHALWAYSMADSMLKVRLRGRPTE